jgi:hypothetical protein
VVGRGILVRCMKLYETATFLGQTHLGACDRLSMWLGWGCKKFFWNLSGKIFENLKKYEYNIKMDVREVEQGHFGISWPENSDSAITG